MIRLFDRLTKAAEKRGWSPALALSAPAWVAVLRMLGERFLAEEWRGLRPGWPWFVHIFAFYLALLTSLGAVLARVVPLDWKKAQSLVGMGLLLGVTPPLIDTLVLGRRAFAYEYAGLFAPMPWSLSGSPKWLPPGETTVLWVSITFMGLYTLRRSGSWLRGLVSSALTYGLVLLFLVLVPGWAAQAGQASGLAPSEWLVLGLVVASQLALVVAQRAERRLVARLPQLVLPALFVAAGAALGGALDGPALLVALAFLVAGAGFALSNDWFDRQEDQAQGRTSPVDQGGAALLSLVPLVATAGVLAHRPEAGLALVAFAVVAHAYHADPLRLKCVFPLSYKTEGLLAGLAAVAGLCARPERPPSAGALWTVLAVAVGTPAALVFKDAKDVDADAKGGVQTAFVFGERHGWPRRRTLAISAALLFVSLAVPAAWLWTRGAAPTPTLAVAALAAAAPAVLLLVPRKDVAVLAAMLCAEAALACVAWALSGRAPA